MILSNSIRLALLCFDEFDEIFVHKYFFVEKYDCWSVYISTYIKDSKKLPSTLFWYCNISRDYPSGAIGVYPCSRLGIKTTFNHQTLNIELTDELWRNGKLCLDSAFDITGARTLKREPRNKELRLKWHITRFLQWIRRADSEQLIEKGDPYELPDFDTYVSRSWGFVGKINELELFKDYYNEFGLFYYVPTEGARFNLILSFNNKKEQEIIKVSDDDSIEKEKKVGLWILLKKEVIVQDWQVPLSYKELRQVLASSGIDFDEILKFGLNKKKSTKSIRAVAIGFPIPEKFEQEKVAIHWQVFEIPEMEMEPRGFRKNSVEIINHNIRKFFTDSKKIKWARSVNINPEFLFSRVPQFKTVSNIAVCVIGLGSLGSIFVEALVRSGLRKVHLIDYDLFREGNLSRHILTMSSLDHLKADEVAKKLKGINPFVQVTASSTKMSNSFEFDTLNEFDVVIDFSASDDVLYLLESQKETFGETRFFSFSFGLFGTPIYCYNCKMKGISSDFLYSEIKSFQNESLDDVSLPNDGIGCWSPVFPSSVFAVQNASHICFEYFISQINGEKDVDVSVYEKIYSNGVYEGTKKTK